MFMLRLPHILIAAAVAFQSLLGTVGSAGVVCLGGGHEHPEQSLVQDCELDCSHTSTGTPLPTPVGEKHSDCGCVDIDLSFSEFLNNFHRVENPITPGFVFAPSDFASIGYCDIIRVLPTTSYWFDPGGSQRVTHLSTVRLRV